MEKQQSQLVKRNEPAKLRKKRMNYVLPSPFLSTAYKYSKHKLAFRKICRSPLPPALTSTWKVSRETVFLVSGW